MKPVADSSQAVLHVCVVHSSFDVSAMGLTRRIWQMADDGNNRGDVVQHTVRIKCFEWRQFQLPISAPFRRSMTEDGENKKLGECRENNENKGKEKLMVYMHETKSYNKKNNLWGFENIEYAFCAQLR